MNIGCCQCNIFRLTSNWRTTIFFGPKNEFKVKTYISHSSAKLLFKGYFSIFGMKETVIIALCDDFRKSSKIKFRSSSLMKSVYDILTLDSTRAKKIYHWVVEDSHIKTLELQFRKRILSS